MQGSSWDRRLVECQEAFKNGFVREIGGPQTRRNTKRIYPKKENGRSH